jgi:hypothetical protein
MRELGPIAHVAGHDDALIAKRSKLGLQRSLAEQGEPGTKLAWQAAEGIHDNVWLLLAVETADVDEQGLVIGKAEFGAQQRVAAARSELADLDPERDDLDRRGLVERDRESWKGV